MLKIIIDSKNRVGKVESQGTIGEMCADYMVIDAAKKQFYESIKERCKAMIADNEGIEIEEVDEETIEKSLNSMFEGFEVAVTTVGVKNEKLN